MKSSMLPRLGLVVLLALSTVVPSSTLANPIGWQVYVTQICYPNPSTCTINAILPEATWGDVFGTVRTSGMPRFVRVYCPGGESLCAGPQYWLLEFMDGSSQGWTYVSDPSTARVVATSPVTGFGIVCSRGQGGGYQCYQGTGWDGGSWVFRAWYDFSGF